ncbi:hypothetical protein OBBRIDRAFT_827594 [Obba rivulosa]|uniref:Zn(2)-C6 fungal-type domain-containing protein n=1 Tax=Obba rivulosa TaxID=1052685 RepID=A0A8E2DJ96_9APHY|nr:hypothetical protein OBBRIDRAFT_827594 [Obba rivulosa]
MESKIGQGASSDLDDGLLSKGHALATLSRRDPRNILPSWTTVQDDLYKGSCHTCDDPGELQYPPSPSAVSSSAVSSATTGYESDEIPSVTHVDSGQRQHTYPAHKIESPSWNTIRDKQTKDVSCSTEHLQVVPSEYIGNDHRSPPSRPKPKPVPRKPARTRRPRVFDSGQACDLCNVRKVKCVKHPDGGSCLPCVENDLKCKTTRELKKPGRPKRTATEITAYTAVVTAPAVPDSNSNPASVTPSPFTSSVSAFGATQAVMVPSTQSYVTSGAASATSEPQSTPGTTSPPKASTSRSSWLDVVLGSD